MNQTIIKTLYLKPLFNTDPKSGRFEKIRDDALLYIIGSEDGSRQLKIIKQPTYTFYVNKTKQKYHKLSMPIEDLIPITCKYDSRHLEMAKAINLENEFKEAKKDWQLKRDWIQRNLYNHPDLYHCDFDIEDDFKMRFNEKYGEHSSDIEYTTSFTDIEVRADLGDFNQYKSEVPICSICHLDAKSETIYVNVLNDPKYPQVKELFNNLPAYVKHLREFLEEIRQESIEKIKKDNGNPNSIHSFKFNFKFFLFETEQELITNYFNIIKETRPDFCGIWNINFDINFIKNRAEKLNLNMADLVSDNIIPPEYRYFEVNEDSERFKTKNNQTHYSRYFDKIISSSTTQWYCQMSLHSNLRKRFLENDYKLDTIGEKYAYMKKLDLEAKGYNVATVYTKNFQLFLDYAIIDPIVQFMIERVNGDISRSMLNCKDTNFFHGLKKTYVIKSELLNFLKNEKKEIIGNNKSYDISESVPGAIVASPQNIVKKGINLLGTSTNIYRNCVDFDISSEYPSLCITYNILKTTLYGRIINICYESSINDEIFNIPISDGIEFNKMLECIDTSIFDIGTKYFSLPKFDEIVSYIEENAIKK